MHSAESIREIQQLLARGVLTYLAIAQMTGVSKAVVNEVANGRRRPRFARQRHRIMPADEGALFRTTSPTAYCADCGRLVKLPCHFCFVSRNVKAGRVDACPPPVDDEPLVTIEYTRRELAA